MQNAQAKALVELNDVSCGLGDRLILRGITWRLEPGQHWGVLGHNGAGKSTFLRLVRGEIWPRAGSGSRRYRLNGRPEESPVGFRRASALVSAELVDRYQRREWNLSVLETVCTGIGESVYLYEDPGPQAWRRANHALEQVGLMGKAEEPLLSLSRGQIKRALLARALVREPKVLFLDEACEDLDSEARADMFRVLDGLAQNGTSLIYATHRGEELLPALSHLLVLEGGRIVSQGPRQKVALEPAAGATTAACGPGRQAAVREHMRSGFIASLGKADVFRERRQVLHGIDWTIEPGQSWALLGPNGAGKTTLLMLLAGELAPALGGEVAWFGEPGHPGLWQLRASVGLVSGDLQARHKRPGQSGLDTVVSGLQGSIGLSSPPSPREIRAAEECLRSLGLEGLAGRALGRLSYGETRKLMIARAMVTAPKLLLLDEPLAGLDQGAKAGVLEVIERLIRRGVSLVMVSHHVEDLPPSLSHVAELNDGRLVFKGTRFEFAKRQSPSSSLA